MQTASQAPEKELKEKRKSQYAIAQKSERPPVTRQAQQSR